MSNEIAVIPHDRYLAVADRDMLQTVIDNLQGERVNSWDLPQVKVPAGGGLVWNVPGPTGTEAFKTIEGVIVCVTKQRSYYRSTEPNNSPPDCVSHDMVTGKGDPGGECAACPMAEFGSAAKGSGQACKESRTLFILLPDRAMPICLTVPPSSLVSLRRYTLSLTAAMWAVSTEIGLEKKVNDDKLAYSGITFRMVGVMPKESQEALRTYKASVSQALGA